jgi:hypothetical protein
MINEDNRHVNLVTVPYDGLPSVIKTTNEQLLSGQTRQLLRIVW